MARALYRLTEQIVRSITAAGYHADGDGLFLQVSKRGTKSWIFRYSLNRRTRDMGLGPLKAVSLADARSKAAAARILRDKGIDPLAQREAERDAATSTSNASTHNVTFRRYANECVDGWTPDWKNPKTANQWRATLERYAYPVIGDLALDAIETAHIIEILSPIWRSKSDTASGLRAMIERVLAAAAVEGKRPAANPATWRGHLIAAKGLGKLRKAVPHKSLQYRNLPAFLAALRKREGVASRALEFVILTAARSGEVRGARWQEIDEAERTWTVPAERMKSGRSHIVPLSEPALAVLAEVKPLRDLGGVIFPGIRYGQPLSDMTLSKLVKLMGYDCVPHGFRATFKTWAEEETDHANATIESALAHAVGDRTEQAYFRGDRLAKRRSLMADWGAYCVTTPAETAVVPLRPGAQKIPA
jgi:integrase